MGRRRTQLISQLNQRLDSLPDLRLVWQFAGVREGRCAGILRVEQGLAALQLLTQHKYYSPRYTLYALLMRK